MRLTGLFLLFAIIIGTCVAKQDSFEKLLRALVNKQKKSANSPSHYARAINEPSCGTNRYGNTVQKKSLHLKKLLREILKDGSKAEELVSRIAYGTDALPGEFPSIAFIHNTIWSTLCGGTLINSEYILSAAHCFFGPKADNYPAIGDQLHKITFYLGEHNNHEDVREASEIGVKAKELYVHQGYDPHDEVTNANDVALIKLETPVTYGTNIRPVCLPTSAVPAGTVCYAAGWGSTETGSLPTILRKVKLSLMDRNHELCSPSNDPLAPGQLCAEKPANVARADACQGDSGGPLYCLINDRFNLVGVTSYGVDCQSGESAPGIYSDVFHYMTWINDVMNGKYPSTASSSGSGGTGGTGGGDSGFGGDGDDYYGDDYYGDDYYDDDYYGGYSYEDYSHDDDDFHFLRALLKRIAKQ